MYNNKSKSTRDGWITMKYANDFLKKPGPQDAF